MCLGYCPAHGVKGLVKILPYGENPYLIELVEDFDIGRTTEYFSAEIAGVTSRKAVDAIKGTKLFIDRDNPRDR